MSLIMLSSLLIIFIQILYKWQIIFICGPLYFEVQYNWTSFTLYLNTKNNNLQICTTFIFKEKIPFFFKLSYKIKTTFLTNLSNLFKSIFFGFRQIMQLRGIGYNLYWGPIHLGFDIGYTHNIVFEIPFGIQLSNISPTKKKLFSFFTSNKQYLFELIQIIAPICKPETYLYRKDTAKQGIGLVLFSQQTLKLKPIKKKK